MADNYVVIRGGLVENDTCVKVYDLDVLDTEFPDRDTFDEVLELLGRAADDDAWPVVQECARWITKYAVNA